MSKLSVLLPIIALACTTSTFADDLSERVDAIEKKIEVLEGKKLSLPGPGFVRTCLSRIDGVVPRGVEPQRKHVSGYYEGASKNAMASSYHFQLGKRFTHSRVNFVTATVYEPEYSDPCRVEIFRETDLIWH